MNAIRPIEAASEGKLAYTVQEAARATGVHKATIWKRIAAGELTTFKWCGRTLIAAEVLHGALERAKRAS